jgi:hypothetical protein
LTNVSRKKIMKEKGLSMTHTPGEVLEVKPVASGPDGAAEWRLEVIDDVGNTLWKPYHVWPQGNETEPMWLPLPGSQYLFLESPVFETLYAGTRGPGKTLTLLMDFAKGVGAGHGKAWRGILFRKKFGDLDDVVLKIEEWFPTMFPGFRFLKSKSEYMGIWPTGESLLLRHMKDHNDYGEYHGHEYPWIGWEELTQWADDKAYKLMFSCCRPPRPGVPCRVRSSTNPYGAGHNWVRRRFFLPEKMGQIIRVAGEVPRVAIHGDLHENFVLLHSVPEYENQVRAAATNPAQAEAWLRGAWDVTAGGMIDDLWRRSIHVIPTIPTSKIPRGWTITRSYDHGQSSPFSVLWWAESNGEPITVDGTQIGRVRGDIILIAEWYGTTGNENQGVRMSARNIAIGIGDREADLGLRGRVRPGPADTEIYNKLSDRDGRCPADDMEDEGILWERADKSPGSRKRGWEMLRTYLTDAYPEIDGTRERPGLFITDREIPDGYEDHCADSTRYRLNWSIPGMWRKGF